jgi:hypothetical protein
MLAGTTSAGTEARLETYPGNLLRLSPSGDAAGVALTAA